jgi:2,4-didehydro-3-deoxy-L-rhamnonate hydrolase
MRLCRFGDNGLGLVRQERVIDVTPVLDRLPSFRYPLPKFDPLIAELDGLRDHIKELADGQQGIPIGEVQLICPIANPGKIVAAPVNYKRP